MVESGSPLPAAWFVSAHHEAESYLPLEPIPRDLIAGPSSGRGGGRDGGEGAEPHRPSPCFTPWRGVEGGCWAQWVEPRGVG